jgi:hypothetical protein
MQARTCLRFGAVSSIDVALRMLVESSVSDLLRSTLRVALYDMVYECGGWPRGVAGSLEGDVVVVAVDGVVAGRLECTRQKQSWY